VNITIEHPCPQCGGPVDLGESDRILSCPYCDVKSCLSTSMPALILPSTGEYENMVYVPYMRFRGSVYSCTRNTVEYQVVDTSLLGVPALTILPHSLGVRPQAMKTHFASKTLPGTFLKCLRSAKETAEQAGNIQKSNKKQSIFHRAYIGETVNIIYQPLFLKDNKLGDAITDTFLARLPKGIDSLKKAIDPSPNLDLQFLATLCPQCGWNLSCTHDSVVLTCNNCDTAWKAEGGKFNQVKFLKYSSGAEESLYLPFWKIEISCRGLELDNFADFAKLINLPMIPQDEWESRPLAFWIPAFKVRPKIFLRLANQLTGRIKEKPGEEIVPKRSHPVNMPKAEALESLKVVLASSSANTEKLLTRLPDIEISETSTTLFYLPFDDSGYDLKQQDTGISLNKQILAWGKYL
jgi:hypothetical protein